MLRNTFLLAIVLLAATAQAGDIYRWKDASGSWHYSDQPVPGAERVGSSRYLKPGANGEPKTETAQAMRQSTAVAPQTAEKVREDLAAMKAGKCKEAQENYQQTINSRRLYRPGPKGEQIFLNDEEIDAVRVTARANLEYYCGT